MPLFIPGGSGGGGGSGSGAFGAVLKQSNDATKGLFVYGDETDPSWHLRGVERQLEELAVRAHILYNGGSGNSVRVNFGDTSRQDRGYRVSPGADFFYPPEEVNQFNLQHVQHPDPSAVRAAYAYGDDVTFLAATAGAAGNNQRVSVTRGSPGRDAVAAAGAVVPIRGFSGVNFGTVINVTFPTAQGDSRNGAEITIRDGVAAAGASLNLDNVGGDDAIAVTFPDGVTHNGTKVVLQAPGVVGGARATGVVRWHAAAADATLRINWHEIGTAGNDFVLTLQNSNLIASGSASATYASNGQSMTVGVNGSVTGNAIIAAINAARHSGSQLIVASSNSGNPASVTNYSGHPVFSVTLASGADGTSASVGDADWDSSSKVLTITTAAASTATQVVGWINGVSAFPGTAAVLANRGATSMDRQTQTAAGGVDGEADGTITWDDDGGNDGTGLLTIVNGATDNATTIAGYINGLSAFPGTAAVVAGLAAYVPVRGTYEAAGGVDAVDAVARSPLSITFATAGLNPVIRTINIAGVLPNVDTIADVRAVLAATTSSEKNFYQIVGTGTDFFITTQADLNGARFIGGEDEATRLDTTVTLTTIGTGPLGRFVTYRVMYYGSDSPEAHRSTMQELKDAWEDVQDTTNFGANDASDVVLTGSTSAKVTSGVIFSKPLGGSDYIAPSPIEFLVRDEDEADGKNIEVRYHHDEDTLQEIIDASLVSATNPGSAKVVEIFGTNLAEEPEEPPFARPMYPEAGAGGGSSFSPTKSNLYTAVKAIFHPATNDGVSADDTNNQLDVAAGQDGGLNPEEVRDTVAAFIQAGANITVVHDDNNDTLTIASTATEADPGLTPEQVRDTVAAFIEAAAGSGLSVTHDDNNDTLTIGYQLPASTETDLGGVRNVSIDQAADTAGQTFLAWSSSMITKLMSVFWTSPSEAEAQAGSATVKRVWTAELVRLAITTVVPSVFRSGNTDRISTGKLGSGNPATKTALFNGAWRQPSFDDLTGVAADNQIPATVARDTEIQDSLTGSTGLTGRLLTMTRRSGSNPLEINLAGLASGAGVPLGSLRSLGFWHPAADDSNGNFLATGIMLPAAPEDEAVFLTTGKWGSNADYPSTNGSLTGAAIKALPTVAVGASTGGTDILHDGVGDTTLIAGKLASGELLLRNDENEWVADGDYFGIYEVLDAAAAGRIVNPDTTTIATQNAGGRFNASTSLLNPNHPGTGAKVVPVNINLLTSGSSLADYATDLSESDDTITLEPGTYIVQFMISVYTSNNAATLYQANDRINTYHEAVMSIGGSDTVISHELSESYVRPINSGPDSGFGGLHRGMIMRVPEKGAVRFRHAATAQTTGGWLATRGIVIYRLTGPDVPQVATPPSISSFALVGDLSPAAGAINETYDYSFAVAQSSHLSALRIVRFDGTDAAPTSVTVLADIASANFHGGSGQITLSGFSLAANEIETVRLEAYGQGQTPATDQPISYHDVRVTAHATTAATRFIRIRDRISNARPTAANLVANMAVISSAGSVIGDWTVAGIPNDNNDWLVGWIVPQSAAQPNHYTSGGLSIDTAVAARFTFSENSVDYWVYLFTDAASADDSYNGATITVT